MSKTKYEEIPVDLTDEEFLAIAKMAHERDITLNQLVEDILWRVINTEKNKGKFD